MASLFGRTSSLRKKIEIESIYDVKDTKVKEWKLLGDSNCMSFAVYLKKEFLGFDFSE